jgi:hypothetical protein
VLVVAPSGDGARERDAPPPHENLVVSAAAGGGRGHGN